MTTVSTLVSSLLHKILDELSHRKESTLSSSLTSDVCLQLISGDRDDDQCTCCYIRAASRAGSCDQWSAPNSNRLPSTLSVQKIVTEYIHIVLDGDWTQSCSRPP